MFPLNFVMRAERIVARGFRNLADLDLPLPPGGAVFLGPNGHGKTNLLELLYYPVLFRSLRGARDADVTVLLFVKQKVVANFAFRSGELSDDKIGDVMKALPRILGEKK